MRRRTGACSAMDVLIRILRQRFRGGFCDKAIVEKVSLAKLLEVARIHGVSWLVCDSLQAAFDRSDTEFALLKSEMSALSVSALKKCADLHKIDGVCRREGIKAVFYKGAALSNLIYGNASARSYQDTDLLVGSYEEALRLRDCLMQDGFVSSENLPDGFDWFKRNYHIEFQLRSPAGFGVDIHWKLFHEYFAGPEIFVGIFSDERAKTMLPVAGREIATVSPELHLLVLCLHHTTHRWNELRLIADIAGMVNKFEEIDYDRLFMIARENGVARMLSVGLRLALLSGARLPEAAWRELRKDRVSQTLVWTVWKRIRSGIASVSKGELMLFEIAARDSWADRCGFIFNAAFSPSDNDLRFMLLKPELSWLYFFLRPIRQLGQILKVFLRS